MHLLQFLLYRLTRDRLMPLYFNVRNSILLEKFKDVLGYFVGGVGGGRAGIDPKISKSRGRRADTKVAVAATRLARSQTREHLAEHVVSPCGRCVETGLICESIKRFVAADSTSKVCGSCQKTRVDCSLDAWAQYFTSTVDRPSKSLAGRISFQEPYYRSRNRYLRSEAVEDGPSRRGVGPTGGGRRAYRGRRGSNGRRGRR